jgi:hypothetical protein
MKEENEGDYDADVIQRKIKRKGKENCRSDTHIEQLT